MAVTYRHQKGHVCGHRAPQGGKGAGGGRYFTDNQKRVVAESVFAEYRPAKPRRRTSYSSQETGKALNTVPLLQAGSVGGISTPWPRPGPPVDTALQTCSQTLPHALPTPVPVPKPLPILSSHVPLEFLESPSKCISWSPGEASGLRISRLYWAGSSPTPAAPCWSPWLFPREFQARAP